MREEISAVEERTRRKAENKDIKHEAKTDKL